MRSRGYRLIGEELRKGVEEGMSRCDDSVDVTGFQCVDGPAHRIGVHVRRFFEAFSGFADAKHPRLRRVG